MDGYGDDCGILPESYALVATARGRPTIAAIPPIVVATMPSKHSQPPIATDEYGVLTTIMINKKMPEPIRPRAIKLMAPPRARELARRVKIKAIIQATMVTTSASQMNPTTRANGIAFPSLLAENPTTSLNNWTNCSNRNNENDPKMPKILRETKGMARNERAERAEPASAVI